MHLLGVLSSLAGHRRSKDHWSEPSILSSCSVISKLLLDSSHQTTSTAIPNMSKKIRSHADGLHLAFMVAPDLGNI